MKVHKYYNLLVFRVLLCFSYICNFKRTVRSLINTLFREKPYDIHTCYTSTLKNKRINHLHFVFSLKNLFNCMQHFKKEKVTVLIR